MSRSTKLKKAENVVQVSLLWSSCYRKPAKRNRCFVRIAIGGSASFLEVGSGSQVKNGFLGYGSASKSTFRSFRGSNREAHPEAVEDLLSGVADSHDLAEEP
jgi:hypothetical protein